MMFQSGPMGLFGSLGAVSKIGLLILFLFSVISWAIILYKWCAFRLSDQDEQRFLSSYSRARDGEELRRRARRLAASPSATVLVGVGDRLSPEADRSGRAQGA